MHKINLPGDEILSQGIAELARGDETILSLLAAIGSPKLRKFVKNFPLFSLNDPEHRLYRLLQISHGAAAHSQYNAWIRRLVSLEHALECAK